MENTNPWVLLIAGALLGWLAGWLMELLFFRKSSTVSTSEQVDALNAQLAACENQMQSLRAAAAANPAADVSSYEAQIAALQTQVASLESELKRRRAAPVVAASTGAAPVVAAAAGVAAGTWGARGQAEVAPAELPTEPSDLEALEGIGPTWAARLRAAGVTNYARLARTTPAWLDDIIKAPAWRRPDYEAWIAQARLAAAGDTAELKALQAELFARKGENLTLIYGIGPAGADALRSAGIGTFAALAAADPDRLRAIALETGIRNPDVDAWIEEARLRAAGRRISRNPKLRGGVTLVACPQDLSRLRGIGSVLETRLYAAGIGTFWEVANMDDDELGRVLRADEVPNLSLSEIKLSARELTESTGTTGQAWDGTAPDDLETIEGIGEIYERRLVEGGICTYRALAAASLDELEAIIKPTRGARPDYASWIKQAQARVD